MVFGQISHGGSPLSFEHKIELSKVAVFTAPKFDYKAILAKELQSGIKSNRYGKVIDVDLNPENSGEWKTLNNGTKLWILKIKSNSAYSLSLIFNNYKLKNGAKIFIYSTDKQQVIGAFTEENNKSNSWFSTVPVKGDEIVIELNTFNNDDYGKLNISGIVHDYKGVMGFKFSLGYGAAAKCNVNINCKDGKNWQVEKKAVAKLYVGGQYCTGTLINNTAQNSKPYLLTAAHCVKSQNKAKTGVFVFNYESEDCESNAEPLGQSISGANLIATGKNSLDFTLLELSTQPPPDYDVYYAGWNRKPTLTDSNLVCIHHARGDIKKINFTKGNVVIDNYGLGFIHNSHYKVKEWKSGTTEEGSSGSALLDNEHLIIGTLTGGDASCDYNFNDFYTRLDICWEYYKESNKQLKKWLDPLNSGVEKLTGRYQNQLTEGYDVAVLNNPEFVKNQCINDSVFAKFTLTNLGKKELKTVYVKSWFNDKLVYEKVWKGSLKSRETTNIAYSIKPENLGDAELKLDVKLPDNQQDINSFNNSISKTVTLIKPVERIVFRGNSNICDIDERQEYSVNAIGNYSWTVVGGKVFTDTTSQNIKVEWNRWGERFLNVTVSNYCNSESADIKIDFVEQQLVLEMEIENNNNGFSWYIVNELGDTVYNAVDLSENGKYVTNICLSAGSHKLIIDKNGANIKNYKLLRTADNYILLNSNNIDANRISSDFQLNRVEDAKLNLYPNPAKDEITIEAFFSEMYKNSQFAVFSSSGKPIVPYSRFDCPKTISISHFKSGTYLVKVKNEFGETASAFVKL